MRGWRQKKRVAFAARRLHTILKGDERVKGHFKPLHSGEPTSEYHMGRWLQKFWRGVTELNKICVAELSSWEYCKCEKHLSWIFPFYPNMGENANVPLHFRAAIKMLIFWSFWVTSGCCRQQAGAITGPVEQLCRRHWSADFSLLEQCHWRQKPGQDNSSASCPHIVMFWAPSVFGKHPIFSATQITPTWGSRACTLHVNQLSSTDFAGQDWTLLMQIGKHTPSSFLLTNRAVTHSINCTAHQNCVALLSQEGIKRKQTVMVTIS